MQAQAELTPSTGSETLCRLESRSNAAHALVFAAIVAAAGLRVTTWGHRGRRGAAQTRERGRRGRLEKRGEGEHLVPEKDKDPLRGTTFLFDQSMSTQTAHLEPSPQQSYVPFYGWWLSLRPRWNFTDHWRVQARLDYYKEFTNSQSTTYYREDVFGDIWTDLVYSTPLREPAARGRTRRSVSVPELFGRRRRRAKGRASS